MTEFESALSGLLPPVRCTEPADPGAEAPHGHGWSRVLHQPSQRDSEAVSATWDPVRELDARWP